jgi:hypothetical protein
MCATIFVTGLLLAPKFIWGHAELLTDGQGQIRLRRKFAGCCDVGQAETRLREKQQTRRGISIAADEPGMLSRMDLIKLLRAEYITGQCQVLTLFHAAICSDSERLR